MRGRYLAAPLTGGRAPIGRRPRAGKGESCGDVNHPRWRQIVSAGPNGVNPAARPDPARGGDGQTSASGVVVG
jgi:hypothetical protein